MEKYRYKMESPTLNLHNQEDIKRIALIGEAIGNEKRVNLLKLLNEPPYTHSVPELVQITGMPVSTLMHHLEKLEKACLINISYKTINSNSVRVAYHDLASVNILFQKTNSHIDNEKINCDFQSMKVGNYSNYTGNQFGFAGKKRFYDFLGSNCFHPKRFDAQIIYSSNGQIEYFFDNKIAKNKQIVKLQLSLEICSEAPYYNNNLKSDITFWINNKELLTYTTQGDYGDRRGTLNPDWWPEKSTQYGNLVSISIDDNGVYLGENLIHHKITINDLKLEDGNKLILRLGNKGTATNIGGWNIFGKEFGDYPQDIQMQLFYY